MTAPRDQEAGRQQANRCAGESSASGAWSAPTGVNLTVIVPTIGRSEHLLECVRRLRSDGGDELEIVIVAQGGFRPRGLDEWVDRVELRLDNQGFTGGCNYALARVERDFVGLVNDDLLVERGWTKTLLSAFGEDAEVASVQGLNLQLERPQLVDGYGIGWNRFWRPVQLGHGAPAPGSAPHRIEIFGASATAAIYRTAALRRLAPGSGEVFDSRLDTYYEDVDLAVRLRRDGWRSFSYWSARALHAGATSTRQTAATFHRLCFSNRLLVAARLFGRSLWRVLPHLLLRDAAEMTAAAARGRLADTGAALSGWWRALRRIAAFGHLGPSLLPRRELERFRVRTAAAALDDDLRRLSGATAVTEDC